MSDRKLWNSSGEGVQVIRDGANVDLITAVWASHASGEDADICISHSSMIATTYTMTIPQARALICSLANACGDSLELREAAPRPVISTEYGRGKPVLKIVPSAPAPRGNNDPSLNDGPQNAGAFW